MRQQLWLLLVCVSCAVPVVSAHHSYAEYDRERPASIEGTLEKVTLGNPHGILMVRTDDGTLIVAEWGNAGMLNRTGFVAGMLNVGDRVVVTGAPTKDPQAHRMSLLSEISRPSDGWKWTKFGVAAPTPR